MNTFETYVVAMISNNTIKKRAVDKKTIKNFVKGLLLAISELLNSSQKDLFVLCIDSAEVSAVKIKKSINNALI